MPPLPKIPGKTQQLYSHLDARHFTYGQFVDRVVKSWSQDKQITPSLLFNAFDEVAFHAFPGLEVYWERFAEVCAKNIHLVGSGPALFALVGDEAKTENVCSLLRQQGLEAYAVSTIIPQMV
jgi:4-diphosphocytidyl-2C-methyl-D-erythritol kinase